MKNLLKYGQYKNDIFSKLEFNFEVNKKILDVGCGDGSDAEIFINEFGLDTYGIDIYKDEKINQIKELKFQKAGIYHIPLDDGFFDYVFLHDVLHHIDEKNQRFEKHIKALKELKRVTKKGGYIIIIEGNRYNPLFYPHMVKTLGHEHWKQSYFKEVVNQVFEDVKFKFFEAHFYTWGIKFWKVYEFLMEKFSPKQFLSYNTAIIKK